VLLVWCVDRAREETFRIPPEGLVLGRGMFDGADDRIGREHLRLAVDKGRLVATDLGSRNGSYVNGHALVARKVASQFPVIARTGRTVWVAVDDVRPYEGVALERRGRLVIRGTLGPLLRDVQVAARDERSIALLGPLTVGRELARCYSEHCLGDYARLAPRAGKLGEALADRNARTIAIELSDLLRDRDVELLRRWLADGRRIVALTREAKWVTGLPPDVIAKLPFLDIPSPRLDELPATLHDILAELAPGASIHAGAIAGTLIHACSVDEDALIAQLKATIAEWRGAGFTNLREDDLDFHDDDPLERTLLAGGDRAARLRRRAQAPRRKREQVPRGEPVDSAAWAARKLCPDGGCIGLIGPDNACRVCGKAVPLDDPYR
jgi:hypothetical protein